VCHGPYFNLALPRLPRPNGTCLDRIKQWLCFQPAPGGPVCAVAPYRVPARHFFRCAPSAGCGAAGGCAPAGGCGTLPMAVTPLAADGYTAAAGQPRVAYQPLTTAQPTPTPTPVAASRVGPVAKLLTNDAWFSPPDVVPQQPQPQQVVPTGGAVPVPTKWTVRQPFTPQ
jgi:hypothetical protein